MKPLVGFESMSALNVFNTLMLGLNMLPAYRAEPYVSFLERINKLPDNEQETLIREAALFVKLEKDEIETLILFFTDPLGVPYGKHNMDNLGLEQIYEMIVTAALTVARIKLTLVSDSEKKN